MKKKLSDKLKGNEDISKQVILKSFEEDTSPRRIFLEDHRILRKLAFESEKTMVEILNDILNYFESNNLIAESYSPYEKHKSDTPHKSVKIPNELNNFIKKQSKLVKIPVKHLLSFMIRDYATYLEKRKEWA